MLSLSYISSAPKWRSFSPTCSHPDSFPFLDPFCRLPYPGFTLTESSLLLAAGLVFSLFSELNILTMGSEPRQSKRQQQGMRMWQTGRMSFGTEDYDPSWNSAAELCLQPPLTDGGLAQSSWFIVSKLVSLAITLGKFLVNVSFSCQHTKFKLLVFTSNAFRVLLLSVIFSCPNP